MIAFIAKVLFDPVFKTEMEFLRAVALFSGLTRHGAGLLLSITHRKHYAAGDTIFSQGQEGNVLYVIRSGAVEIRRGGRVLSVMGPGDYFGEMALLDNTPRSADAVVTADAELILMYKSKFDELIDENPVVGTRVLLALARILSERLRAAQDLR